MKIRQGFVSNSSSSSFVINDPNNNIKTIDIAADMIDTIIEDYLKDADNRVGFIDSIETLNNFKNITLERKEKFREFYKKNKDFNDNIIIPYSCNYETFIWRNEHNQILIKTCNNHVWNLYDQFETHYLDENDPLFNISNFDNEIIFTNLDNLKTQTRIDFWFKDEKGYIDFGNSDEVVKHLEIDLSFCKSYDKKDKETLEKYLLEEFFPWLVKEGYQTELDIEKMRFKLEI